MIEVTRINDRRIMINKDLIGIGKISPDTITTMIHGYVIRNKAKGFH